MTVPSSAGNPDGPHAGMVADERRQRAERHSRALAEIRSAQNPPQLRIWLWEQLHEVRMPAEPEHPVLDVIAVGTGLTIAEVREEQRLRALRGKPPAPPSPTDP